MVRFRAMRDPSVRAGLALSSRLRMTTLKTSGERSHASVLLLWFMQYMQSVPSAGEPLDLIDLKFLPAWVKEDWSAPRHAEWEEDREPWSRGSEQRRDRPPRRPRREQKNRDRRDRRSRDERKTPDRRDRKGSRDFPLRRDAPAPPPLPQLDVHFLPQAAAFENVAAQIKSG